jgi:hypothetical protein
MIPSFFQSTCCYCNSLLICFVFYINYIIFEYEPLFEVLCEPWFGVKRTFSQCTLEKIFFYVNFAHFRKYIGIDALWMRSSRVFRASDCQCRRCNSPWFNPSILWVESERRQMKRCRIMFFKNPEKPLINICIRYWSTTCAWYREGFALCGTSYTVKKRLAIFPSSAGRSPTKLSLAGIIKLTFFYSVFEWSRVVVGSTSQPC